MITTAALHVRSVAHPLAATFQDWNSEISGRWSYEKLRRHSAYKKSWISFDVVEYCPIDGRIHCGLSTLAGASIHWTFDPKTARLASLGFETRGDDYDAKIHRNIHFSRTHAYFGTAQFHDAPQQLEAMGGKLVAYDFKTRTHEILGTPCPHNYIQSTACDFERGILYCQTYPMEQLVRFDLKTKRCRTLCWLGNTALLCQAHNPVLDREGHLWATWGELRAWDDERRNTQIRFLTYDPDADRITWHEFGAPKLDAQDQGQIDSLVLGPDGMLFGGTTRGSFFCLNPATCQVENLGKPCPEVRLAALKAGPDGWIYAAGGFNFKVNLFRFQPQGKRLETLGRIADSTSGEACERAHDLTVSPDGTVYVGENDTHHRTSRLWVCAPEGRNP